MAHSRLNGETQDREIVSCINIGLTRVSNDLSIIKFQEINMTTADAILAIEDREEQYRHVRTMTVSVSTGKFVDLEGRFHSCRCHHFKDGSILDAVLDGEHIEFMLPQSVMKERIREEFQRIFSR